MAEATEVALVLAQLVSDHRAFPDDAARDLHRMLGIASPSPAPESCATTGCNSC